MATPRKSAARFHERAEVLDFLLEVARVTAETLDLDKILENVAAIVKTVVPYDAFAVLLLADRAKALRIRYSVGYSDEVVRNLLIPLTEGLTGAAAASRAPIIVDDVRVDSRYLNVVDSARSELAVPMIARGKLVGVIDVQSTRTKAFAQPDRALLSLIAGRVAVAVDNASLYRRIDRQNRTLRTLAHISQEFSSILDLDELLGKIAGIMRVVINYDAFSILLVDPEKKVLRQRFSVRYDERVVLDNIPLGKGITGAAAEARETVLVADTLADPRYIASNPGIRSEMAVPLIVQDRVVGVLDLESERLAYFTEDHRRTLSLLAPQIASSVENARLYGELAIREQRMEDDLKAARKLQQILQPKHAPEIRGLESAICARPAREISGDVYDFFDFGDDYSVIVFGDVSGKGAAAALYGALVSGLLRILAPRRRSPALLMQSLNETLLERKVDAQYATLLVVLWEPRSGVLTICNAGAEPPMIYRRGEVMHPKVEGIPIGLLEDQQYEEFSFETEPGDVIMFMSDGVGDQLNSCDEEFSRSRLSHILKRSGEESSQDIACSIFAELDQFRDGMPITDDQSVLVMRVS